MKFLFFTEAWKALWSHYCVPPHLFCSTQTFHPLQCFDGAEGHGFSKQTKLFHACALHMFFTLKPPPQSSWEIPSLPSEAIRLCVSVCLSHPQNPQHSLILLSYYVIFLYLISVSAHCILASTFSIPLKVILLKLKMTITFIFQSSASFLDLSLFGPIAVFETGLCPCLGVLAILLGCEIPTLSWFSSSSLTSSGLIFFCLLSLHS